MPRYDYQCEKCGKEFEELVSISERDLFKRCPECGVLQCKRIYKEAPHFKQGGQGMHPDNWTDTFWDKAERERVTDMEKRQRTTGEKIADGDKDVTQAIQNKIVNTANVGGKRESDAMAKEYDKMMKKGRKNADKTLKA